MEALISLESQMLPPSEATKLETTDGLVEYAGSGKLKDKKVLITGGEYVPCGISDVSTMLGY